jgi:hypothetical protein
MNIKNKVFLAFLVLTVCLFGCGPDPVQKDAKQLSEVWCRYIEIMSRRQIVDPEDTVADSRVESELEKVMGEMDSLNTIIRKKYGEKTKDTSFSRRFKRELQKAMLNCPNLSKTDRDKIEKELKEK